MEGTGRQDALRIIPPVNEVIDCPEVRELIRRYGREVIVDITRQVIGEYRENLNIQKQSQKETCLPSRQDLKQDIAAQLLQRILARQKSELHKVINATGIVLHTNLGRAPLPEDALNSMYEIGRGYSNLEYDLGSGTRGSRHSHVERLITRITGAESAVAVNNNAAAVFLCLNTLASGREVIVSRGQQVEIGGSFRIPDIIAQSGAKMVEVGTTNKTRLSDYAGAVGSDTSVLLKVHTSNYRITGFVEEVTLCEMSGLGKEKGIIIMEDLGSGSLYDLTKIGLPYEPLVGDSIKAGADIVTFSGDKLLGGPQAGIIAGKKELIDRIKKNPLMRMVRCDKTTIAALVSVLEMYMDMDSVVRKIPVLNMMAMKDEELTGRAMELKEGIDASLGEMCLTEIVEDQDEVGGGSLPGVVLKGRAVAIASSRVGANELQAGLRSGIYPVVCRINNGRILLNVRTMDRRDYPAVIRSLAGILGQAE